MFGFYRLAAAVPRTVVADVAANTKEMIRLIGQADAEGAAVVLFPEMSVTGYSIGDLVFQPQLLDAAAEGIRSIARATADSCIIAIVGAPLMTEEKLYNAAWVIQAGHIVGIVPKQVLVNYAGFAENRCFRSGRGTTGSIDFDGEPVPFGVDLVFQHGRDFRFGIEICEDLWSVTPPSGYLALGGALAVFNPAASVEYAGKRAFRRDLVKQQSARIVGAYVMASAGANESTTDVVYSGHALIAEDGRLAKELEPLARQSEVIYADADFEKLAAIRRANSSFKENELPAGMRFRRVTLPAQPTEAPDFAYTWNPKAPMIPEDAAEQEAFCREVFSVQCAGLAKRVEHTHAKSMVIGVSGGLDSTLALLVAAETAKMLQLPPEVIRAYTLPGFGTTKLTRGNSEELCDALGIPVAPVDITKACLQHFADIGHDPAQLDTAYENVQARERTQILMDIANQTGGMVIGTGDLSEVALGWCTYNGDHMAMYGVNASVPKTLIRVIVDHIARGRGGKLGEVLRRILDTPVSPELLPPEASGEIGQKTEDILGPYELHDFFLYHFLTAQTKPEKMLNLALDAWGKVYDRALIERTLNKFLSRFFRQQFKRSCMPDGVQATMFSLSPRGSWRMPSDASDALWR